jgi:DNA helicase-2/ATP-dependent DNA helicase PcrA
MDDILHGLNPAQRAAVTCTASVLQVLAPPGSGKTKTLTARVAYLIAHEKLKPWNIITCTFTRKAAKEMKERIHGFVGEEVSKQIKLGTFHAITVQYLRRYGHHIGLEKDFGIADASDSKAILKRIIKKHDFGLEPSKALTRISIQKVKGIDSDLVQKKNVERQEFAQVFAEYETELKASNLLDYDDVLLRCCFLMRTFPECVSNVEAVLIDEFQDTNNIQYDLMGLFAQKRNHITIVGDPDQSIYGFRNAEIKNLTRMRHQWPHTVTINLEENYRSSAAILHAAQHIIEQDENRPQKKLQANHGLGQRPVLRRLPSANAEAAWLVSEIKRIRALTGNLLQVDDVAILLRTAALSRVIEGALGKEGIPYRMVGGHKFFERAEVKLVIDYLRVINQPHNNEAVERIINVPSRRIGDVTIQALRQEADAKGMSLWSLVLDVAQGRIRSSTKLNAPAEKGLATFVNVIVCGRKRLHGIESNRASLVDLINLVIKKIDLLSYLKNKYENEHEARWANVEELIAQAVDASDPERLQAMMQEHALPAIDGLEQRSVGDEDVLSLFLANIALSTSGEEKSADGSDPVLQVTISTIHSAKGLEWPVVFIPACYEGSIPHSRSDDNDEERRLLYVGMTRAKAMLYMSCPVKNTQCEDTTMSCFLLQPGVANFFEEHGPSIIHASATGLATTLRREPPSEEAICEARKTLDRDEDNYWPLNGDDAPEEIAKWDYGKATNPLPAFGITRSASWVNTSLMAVQQQQDQSVGPTTITAGFVSVKAKYEELVEQNKLSAVDRRAEARKKNDVEAPKGRKRQIEGQGSIAGFFAKRQQKSGTSQDPFSAPGKSEKTGGELSRPLRDITNQDQPRQEEEVVSRASLLHKLRTAPLRTATSATSVAESSGNDSVFLSSSLPQPESDENQLLDTNPNSGTDAAGESTQPAFKPATTFHTTSMQSVQQTAQRGKRYGVKPSFNGWANRGRR